MMECQHCHLRPATFHFSKTVNGQKVEYHLCSECAKQNGEVVAATSGSFSIHELLSGLLNFEQPTQEARKQAEDELRCPHCGMTYSQFVNIGKFGCAECYKTFNNRLDPIFRKVHGGNTVHKGKIPRRMGRSINEKRKLADLKSTLKTLVENEQFEKAAEVRDRIRALEDRGK